VDLHANFKGNQKVLSPNHTDHFMPFIALTDRVEVLYPTRHKVSNFRHVFPSQSLGLVL